MKTRPSQILKSRRDFLSAGLAGLGATLTFMPSKLFAEFEKREENDGNGVVMRFVAMSDVHFKTSETTDEVDRLRRALKFMYEYSRAQKYTTCDALLVAGDFSDHGWDDELLLFKRIVNEGIKPETQKVFCMGNHEFYGGSKARWEEIFECDSNKVYDVKGFKFIALSPEKGTCRNGDYLYAFDWYKNELDKATEADPDKPIFTFQHYHVTPTVYGSRGEDDWGISDLYEILQRHPRVINFSGHSHYPINDPRSVWQGNFTALGTGTLSYFEMGGEGGKYSKFPEGYRRAAQFYVVEVRADGSVSLKPYDLITNSFFNVTYYVSKPGAIRSYLYTDERYAASDKPEWKDDAKIDEVKLVDESTATLRFPQAECRDIVHSYRVELKRLAIEDDKKEWVDEPPQYFWSEYYFNDQPKTMETTLEGLYDNASYRAEIVAISPFYKESERRLTAEFKTPRDASETVDKTASKPDANVLDVQFVDGKPVNLARNARQKQREVEPIGAPKIISDPQAPGVQVAEYNGVDQFHKIKFDSRSYAKISRNATFAVKFQFSEFPSQAADVFSNTENGGICFELKPDTKTLEFWVNVNGRYNIVSVPIEPRAEYYDAFGTYDGKDVALYLDGKEVARSQGRGKITYPTETSVQSFCVGSDIAPGGAGGAYFKGRVARARIFGWTLTNKQIANLHE